MTDSLKSTLEKSGTNQYYDEVLKILFESRKIYFDKWIYKIYSNQELLNEEEYEVEFNNYEDLKAYIDSLYTKGYKDVLKRYENKKKKDIYTTMELFRQTMRDYVMNTSYIDIIENICDPYFDL